MRFLLRILFKRSCKIKIKNGLHSNVFFFTFIYIFLEGKQMKYFKGKIIIGKITIANIWKSQLLFKIFTKFLLVKRFMFPSKCHVFLKTPFLNFVSRLNEINNLFNLANNYDRFSITPFHLRTLHFRLNNVNMRKLTRLF